MAEPWDIIAAIGATMLLESLVSGDPPSSTKGVRIRIQSRIPTLGVAEASIHGETVLPIMSYFAARLPLQVTVSAAVLYVDTQSVKASEEKVEEVGEKLSTSHSAIWRGHAP